MSIVHVRDILLSARGFTQGRVVMGSQPHDQFLGPFVCVIMGSRGQNITVPLEWDGMGPLGLYVGGRWDGKLGRLSSMGTTWESTNTEMGWNGMRL